MNKKIKLIQEMMDIQDRVNSQVDSNWKELNRNWLRASWIEAAELMDWIGWKWWKNQELNKKQAQIELVDIWHFLLSEALVTNLSAEDLALCFEEESIYCIETEYDIDYSSKEDLLNLIEVFVYECVNGISFDFYDIFAAICKLLDLDFDKLYVYYIGKAALNNFRQANGYKEGTYIKQWKLPQFDSAAEDNYFLELILDTVVVDDLDDVMSYITSQLEMYYSRIEK